MPKNTAATIRMKYFSSQTTHFTTAKRRHHLRFRITPLAFPG
jgi:hypothetical protein